MLQLLQIQHEIINNDNSISAYEGGSMHVRACFGGESTVTTTNGDFLVKSVKKGEELCFFLNLRLASATYITNSLLKSPTFFLSVHQEKLVEAFFNDP